ncbi:MAG TPA: stage 0 sporulation family protein [Firmicutes bacterium]|nr:stage 0 sporulation family protein [Bacillota bacterium]
MVTVVGIRFKEAGKIYYFSPGDLKIAVGDGCIVETARGVEYGETVIAPRQVTEKEIVRPLKEVLRLATEDDYRRLEENKARAAEAYDIALEKIAEHGLPMKLLHAEYTLDNRKLIFSFSAEGRVDFRELVKDLAAIFRLRIELRQIGVRDEAKMVGGLGSCGRQLCCTLFLGDFKPVSIRLAKEQNLSLNPSKISGACGRLMCCLKFEADIYKDSKEAFGTACPGCLPEDEYYYEPEEEEGYYDDLLQEEGIKEVDYQMMVETAEVEKRTSGEKAAQPRQKKGRSARRRPRTRQRKPKGD